MSFQLLFFYTETLKDFKMQIQIFLSKLVFSYFVTLVHCMDGYNRSHIKADSTF